MIIQNLNYSLWIFIIILGVTFYDYFGEQLGFTYTDELLALMLFIYWLVRKKDFRFNKEFCFFLFVAIIYIVYNLFYPNNIIPAVWTDFFIQIKPFISFYAIYSLDFSILPKQTLMIKRISLAIALFILPFGILYFGEQRMGLWSAPRYATMAEILAIVYLIFSEKRKKDMIVSILIMSLGIFTLKGKFVAFWIIYIAILLYKNNLSNLKIISVKNITFVLILLAVVLYFTWDKIYFYFIVGSQNIDSMFARPYLYYKTIEILKDYPLMGCGLGTYATYASSYYYSPLYVKYGMISNYEIGNNMYLSDTFYPALIQFGIIGIYLFIKFWKKRSSDARLLFKLKEDVILYKVSILIIIFFVIESIPDSTFLQNRGMAMMVILAYLTGKTQTKNLAHEQK